MGYSPWSCKKLGTTVLTKHSTAHTKTHTHTHTHTSFLYIFFSIMICHKIVNIVFHAIPLILNRLNNL